MRDQRDDSDARRGSRHLREPERRGYASDDHDEQERAAAGRYSAASDAYFGAGVYPALGAYDRRLGGNRGPDIPGRDRSPYGDSGFRRPGDEDRGFLDRASDEVASWFGDEEAARRREVDHRGKGPRGYRRADARIAEDLNDRLCDDPALDATDIEVSVADGEVVLAGHVDSKVARRRAEDCAEAVSGVAYVQNNLRVRPLGQVPPATTPAP